MIPRALTTELLQQLQEFPIVTVLGPRQAGKTTLVRHALPDYTYVNLEIPDIRQLADDDPRAFLRRYPDRVIFDEIQRVPGLLSYLQGMVDERKENGRFVLTGSHQLELRAAVSQSLAGRTGLLHLLPFSIAELNDADLGLDSFEDYIWQGFLPRIYDQKQRPVTAWRAYYQTYLERDVRQLIQLKDASQFEKFVKLLAGRVGQIINHQSLAADVGVDSTTVKHWLSILEASFLIFKLPPWFENIGKRVIKSPKYYFTDVGLLAYLLDISKPEQVTRDPLVGNLFENLVVMEAIKTRYNQGQDANLYFLRDSHGNEIDLLLRRGRQMMGIEIKSAATWHGSFTKNLDRFHAGGLPMDKRAVIYGGDDRIDLSSGITVLPFAMTAELFGQN